MQIKIIIIIKKKTKSSNKLTNSAAHHENHHAVFPSARKQAVMFTFSSCAMTFMTIEIHHFPFAY